MDTRFAVLLSQNPVDCRLVWGVQKSDVIVENSREATPSVWWTEWLGWEPKGHSPQCTHNLGRYMIVIRKQRQEVAHSGRGRNGARQGN